MRRRILLAAAGLGLCAIAAAVLPVPGWIDRAALASEPRGGIIHLKSGFGFDATVVRLKADVAAKGILLFAEIDQARLAANAGIKLAPSTLLLFGNPPLGTLFITANPLAGLDWPVRLLVFEQNGEVQVAYTDFVAIAQRHEIRNRDVELRMATSVIASITSAVTGR